MSSQRSGPSAKKILLVGVVGGLLAVVAVRFAVGLLLGGVRAIAIIGVVALAWLLLRGPRPPRA